MGEVTPSSVLVPASLLGWRAEEFWRRYDEVEVRLTASVSEKMLDLCGLGPGMRVLDLATGRGEPAIRAAKRVGVTGSVCGVEISDGVLRMARERADREGLSNLDLRVGNAEALEGIPRGHFDAVTVRWGLMSMASPVEALANARGCLRPEGVLVAALWAEPDRVPYYTLPRQLLERYRRLPSVEPEAPGMFRYATLEPISRDFERGGFKLEHIEEMEVSVFEAELAEDIIDWVRPLGLTPLLNVLPEQIQRAWEQDLKRELERTRTGNLIRLGGITRLIVARPL